MLIVINTESSNEVVGIYVRTEEDTVGFNDWETGELRWAPGDCVAIVEGEIVFRGPGGLQQTATSKAANTAADAVTAAVDALVSCGWSIDEADADSVTLRGNGGLIEITFAE